MEKITLPFEYLNDPQQRIYWFYLASAFLVASIPYMVKKAKAPKGAYPGLFSYLFPKQIYFNQSAINDYLFFFSNTLFLALLITPAFSLLTINVANLVNSLLSDYFVQPNILVQLNRLFMAISLTIILALLSDFAIFFIHYLQHRIPWLWEFHKVHHSAEVLTPITVYRMHPVDIILTTSFSGLFVGAALGTFQFIFKSDVPILNISGTNLIFIFFYLCAYNLRHSHIWLSYGRFFEHIFISPAQHQIHHSSDSSHFDKNMGFIFAFWDYLFGTLYVPERPEIIRYGINQQENKHFNSFWSLYLMPFISIFRKFHFSDVIKVKRLLSFLVFAIIVGVALLFSNTQSSSTSSTESIFLEDMTWQEVRDAISNGNNRVIIPTAGIEQNGPHMVLGKHDHVIRYTSSKIAEKIKHTLVAPVINFVPEGNIDPPDGHMRFSGTVSVSEQLFSELLKSTATSLKAHGFKTIYFIGDSGGNQASQHSVALELREAWSVFDVQVFHIGDYYYENGQSQYLLNKGFKTEQIGSHAGIRDTSELLKVYPKGVRNTLLNNYSTSDFIESGANGDASKADPGIGQVLLDLKINAAVNQINFLHSQ